MTAVSLCTPLPVQERLSCGTLAHTEHYTGFRYQNTLLCSDLHFKLVMRLNVFQLLIGYFFFQSKLFIHSFSHFFSFGLKEIFYKVNNLFILIDYIFLSCHFGDFFFLTLRKFVPIPSYKMYFFFCVCTFFFNVYVLNPSGFILNIMNNDTLN